MSAAKTLSRMPGCKGMVMLGRRYRQRAETLALEYRDLFGVYRCPHCQDYHLTRKARDERVLHITEDHRMIKPEQHPQD